jgi:adenosylcobinamide-GDP ribazoletransferase
MKWLLSAKPVLRIRKNNLGPLLSALHFLTTIPLLPERPYSHEEFGRAVGFFPLVGLIIGGILVGINYLLGFVFPEMMVAALTLGCWLALTGALHLDGFLDSFDGLLGGYDETSRLKIMKDERVGAFGFAAGAILLLLKFVAIDSITGFPLSAISLLLAPTLGRWSLSLAIVAFPYAREKGLGRGVKDFSTWRQVVLSTVTALLVSLLTAQWLGLAIMGIITLVVWLSARFAMQRIPGLTGDIYGAICEISELVVLLLLVVRWPL